MERTAPTTTGDQVRRATRGDRTAFGSLVEIHWASLVRLARSVVGEVDAEDAVQDALVVAWRRLGGLREPEAFSGWLTRIVLRLCLRRARRARPWLPLSVVPDPPVVSPCDGMLDVERILTGLAPRQRAVLHMTAVEGMTDREIAEIMGITAASVRSHRRRARQRLDQLVQGDPRP